MSFSGLTRQGSGYRLHFGKHGFLLQDAGTVLTYQGNRRVPACNLKVLVNINTMKREEHTMTIRLRENCTPYSSDQMTDDLTKEDPPPPKWRLKREDYNAARRALYAARIQLA
jgi:hypothetical protein